MHVHTRFSGACTIPVLRRFTRESYTDPAQLAATLRARGMDLITVTDHDSIDAAERLRRDPAFFLSEEVTCHTPSGTEAHIAVYDLDERQHVDVQARRNDLPRLLAYLEEQNLFAGVMHAASSLTGLRRRGDFFHFAAFPACEARNGQIPRANNASTLHWARATGRACIAGSDAHTLDAAGRTYTEVPGARNKAEFFAGLRRARGRLQGAHGSLGRLTRDVLNIGRELAREHPPAWLLAPAALLVPEITALQYLADYAAALWWRRALRPPQRPDAGAFSLRSWLPGVRRLAGS